MVASETGLSEYLRTLRLVKIAVRVSISDVAGIPVFTAAVFDADGVDGSVAANTRDDPNERHAKTRQNTPTVILKTFFLL
jgi:hypothetical protein